MANTQSGSVIGELLNSQKKVGVTWEIPNYFSHPQKTDYFFDSPSFYFANTTWCLRIFPNGIRYDQTVGWFRLCLVRKSGVPIEVSFTLGIKADKRTVVSKTGKCFFEKQDIAYGWSELYDQQQLLQLKTTHVPGGMLTLYCEAQISSIAETGSQTSHDSSTALIQDIENLLLNEQESDVTIKVQDRAYKAHKLILQARSPVFAAMFEHNMLEKNDNVVKIVDSDPETFQKFLHYVYSGKVENVSTDNVIGLHTIADKYCLSDLKEQCLDFMKADLSVDTACDVFLVADRYDETELKKSAKDLIIKNIKTIIPTEKWKYLLIENYELGMELLMNAIPDVNNTAKGGM